MHEGVLCCRGANGLMVRYVDMGEAKIKLKEVHEWPCGASDANLYRRVQRQGYYWPDLAKDDVTNAQSFLPQTNVILLTYQATGGNLY